MTWLLSRRSLIATLVVVAIIGAVLFADGSRSGLSADEDERFWPDAPINVPRAPAMFSACVGAAAEPAGFSDIAGSTHEAAINCLAHYRITKGTTDGAYNGSGTVTRWQMALFMTRGATPAGVVLEPDTDQGFVDISGLSPEARTAINKAVATGLAEGSTGARFDPHAAVTRAEMAVWVHNFLSRSTPYSREHKSVGWIRDVPLYRTFVSRFSDIQDLDRPVYEAIRRLNVLGVTTGTTPATYSPSVPVTRAQMASFIARALSYTMARPVGLSAQTDRRTSPRGGERPKLYIDLREEDFSPSDAEYINVMTVETKDIDKAFKSDGTCDLAGGYFKNEHACEIPRLRHWTYKGTYVWSDATPTDTITDYTIYAWTPGDARQVTYDRDLHPTASVAFSVLEYPDGYEITTNLPEGKTEVKFGDEIEIIVQLLGTDATPEGSTRNTVAMTNWPIQVRWAFFLPEKPIGANGDIRIDIPQDSSWRFTDPDGKVVTRVKWDNPPVGKNEIIYFVFGVDVIELKPIPESKGEFFNLTWSY